MTLKLTRRSMLDLVQGFFGGYGFNEKASGFHRMLCLKHLFLHNCLDPGPMILPPFDHLKDDIAKRIAIIRGKVFDDAGRIGVRLPPDDLIGFQLFQLA